MLLFLHIPSENSSKNKIIRRDNGDTADKLILYMHFSPLNKFLHVSIQKKNAGNFLCCFNLCSQTSQLSVVIFLKRTLVKRSNKEFDKQFSQVVFSKKFRKINFLFVLSRSLFLIKEAFFR